MFVVIVSVSVKAETGFAAIKSKLNITIIEMFLKVNSFIISTLIHAIDKRFILRIIRLVESCSMRKD